ncbi:MAG: sodium-dependent transporter [bacterium]
MNANGNKRGLWSSKLGFILAGAGSAIGLGNIWRFPMVTAQNGGAVFVLFYLVSVVLICFSVMIAELTLGRNTQRNPVGVYNNLAPGSSWKYLGLLGVITGWGISSFYSVVAGWTLGYIFFTATGVFTQLGGDPGGVSQVFGDFVANPYSSIGLHAAFIFLTMLILFGGVKAGIEKWSKILMPVLLGLLILLVVRSVTFSQASIGLSFYLKPDWSAFSGSNAGKTIVAAVGQAFFSLSLGMGTMITYGSYLSKKENIVSSARWVAFLDTLIALLAGLVIFPALFSSGLDNLIDKPGAGLIFQVLPNVFNEIPFGNVFGTAFFILLAIAAVTSLISILEVPAAYFIDEMKWSRKKSVLISGIGAFMVGIPAALSLGAVDGLSKIVTIQDAYGEKNYGFLDLMNLVFGQYSLIIGSLGVALFVGWKWGMSKINAEITEGHPEFKYKKPLSFFLRLFTPIAIAGLLIYLILNPNAFY